MSETADLPGRLRSTTEQMAKRCNVDFNLWNVHSNTVLEAASEIERLEKQLECERSRAELAMKTAKLAVKTGEVWYD